MTELFEDNIGNHAYKIRFRDVWLVAYVTESDIEWELQAENILLCEFFALDYQSYAYYGAF